METPKPSLFAQFKITSSAIPDDALAKTSGEYERLSVSLAEASGPAAIAAKLRLPDAFKSGYASANAKALSALSDQLSTSLSANILGNCADGAIAKAIAAAAGDDVQKQIAALSVARSRLDDMLAEMPKYEQPPTVPVSFAPSVPPNPIHKTNRLLSDMRAESAQTREIMATSVEVSERQAKLIETLIEDNRKGGIQTKRANWIALGSFLAAVGFGAAALL